MYVVLRSVGPPDHTSIPHVERGFSVGVSNLYGLPTVVRITAMPVLKLPVTSASHTIYGRKEGRWVPKCFKILSERSPHGNFHFILAYSLVIRVAVVLSPRWLYLLYENCLIFRRHFLDRLSNVMKSLNTFRGYFFSRIFIHLLLLYAALLATH